MHIYRNHVCRDCVQCSRPVLDEEDVRTGRRARAPRSLSVAAAQPKSEPPVPEKKNLTTDNNTGIEPSFLIAVPIIAFAIQEGLIEKDGMIVVQKNDDDASSVYLKKPVDILKDKDKDGLKAISRIIGKKNIEVFLNRQGVKIPDKSLSVDTITGNRLQY